MVIYDQLRISDDGRSLFIDAHVNEAHFFDNVYMKKITICTEDQVSETNPLAYGEDFIYQEDIEPLSTLAQVYNKVQILSELQLTKAINSYGGWTIDYESVEGSVDNYLSLVLSGKFSAFETGFTPKLVVTTNAFNPVSDRLNNPEILFSVDGEPYEEKGHRVWQFKGKGDIKLNQVLNFYLYKQTEEGTFAFVRLDETDDVNFLHFLWQIYLELPESNKKEVHLILNKESFNEKFTALDLSHNMFFVYIECEGTPDPCTPCRLDEMTTLGVTYDYGLFYNQAMNYTRELADECNIPQNFLDFILNVEALKLSIETEHYVPAIQYWRNLLGGVGANASRITKPCGCHG